MKASRRQVEDYILQDISYSDDRVMNSCAEHENMIRRMLNQYIVDNYDYLCRMFEELFFKRQLVLLFNRQDIVT